MSVPAGQEEGNILNEMELFTGLLRSMNGSLVPQPHVKRRGSTYHPALDDALRVIAETLDHICAERLTPCLVRTAQDLSAHGELDVFPCLLGKLVQISFSSVWRRSRRLRQDKPACLAEDRSEPIRRPKTCP